MKFLAILRDSVREALDTWIIYFLFALSGLFVLLAFSLSFRPELAEDGVKAILARFPGGRAGFRSPAPVSYAIESFEETSGAKRPWEGAYQYDLVITETQQASPEGEEDPDDPQPKKKKPRPRVSPFRMMVLMDNIAATPEADLTDNEKAARDHMRSMQTQVIRSAGKMTVPQLEKMAQTLFQYVNRVDPDQMGRFLRRHQAAKGGMDVTDLYLKETQGQTFRFHVECKARADAVRSWPHKMGLLFGALTWPGDVSVGDTVYSIQKYLVTRFGAGLAMLVGTVVTAFFIPNMLRKGTIDLLLAKPIHRGSLLLFKYLGGLSFMFLTSVVIVVGVWLAMGLRSGLWSSGFLLSIFVLLLQFAIFYALSTLLGVLTQSPIVAILGTVAFWFLLFLSGWAPTLIKPFHEMKVTPEWVFTTVDSARIVLPRYYDLDTLNDQLIARDLLSTDDPIRREIDKTAGDVRWGESLGVTFGFIGLMLGLACWRFATKDY